MKYNNKQKLKRNIVIISTVVMAIVLLIFSIILIKESVNNNHSSLSNLSGVFVGVSVSILCVLIPFAIKLSKKVTFVFYIHSGRTKLTSDNFDKYRKEYRTFYKNECVDTLRKWYILPSGQKFKVKVIQKETNQELETFSTAVECFLNEMKNETEISAYAKRYILLNEQIAKDVSVDERAKESNEVENMYRLLYFCFYTMSNIVIPPSILDGNNTIIVKSISVKESRFFVYFNEVELEKFNKISRLTVSDISKNTKCLGCYIMELWDEIIFEKIIPQFFVHLGENIDKELIAQKPEILKLQDYVLTQQQ
ncbi:MAG: hypothetical protein K2K85_04770 [Clostridia bacterium]|nr:hypothetical protein [Clostridia bacterium]